MSKGATARRYAEAVFEIGQERGTLDRWRDDLRVIAEYFGNARLLFILREPKISQERKEGIIRDLLASSVQPDALNLAMLLSERELADLGPRISAAFEERYNAYRGQVVAQVTTAIPLDAALRAQITGQLAQFTGKQVLLEEQVDPSILGGVVARVGDTLIDGSLKRRFHLLREQMMRGQLGGPDDGMLNDLLGSIGPFGPGGAAPGDGAGPFVVAPGGSGGQTGRPNAGGGPTQSAQVARRASDAPHMAPQHGRPGQPEQSGQPGRQTTSGAQTGAQDTGAVRGDNRNKRTSSGGANGKRRRR